MSLDGISRESVWVLTLRRVARGGMALHGTGHVTARGSRVAEYTQTGVHELLACGLLHAAEEQPGWNQQRLRLTNLGRDVLVDLLEHRPDHPSALDRRVAAGLRNPPGIY